MTPQDQQHLAELIEAEYNGLTPTHTPNDGQNVVVMVKDLLNAIELTHQRTYSQRGKRLEVDRYELAAIVALARDIQGRL